MGQVVGTPAGTSVVPDVVRFEVVLGGGRDFNIVRQGLLAQGNSVLFLRDINPPGSPTMYRPIRNGATTALVEEAGRLPVPFAGADGSWEMLLARTRTPSELLRAADRPGYVVTVLDPMYKAPTSL